MLVFNVHCGTNLVIMLLVKCKDAPVPFRDMTLFYNAAKYFIVPCGTLTFRFCAHGACTFNSLNGMCALFYCVAPHVVCAFASTDMFNVPCGTKSIVVPWRRLRQIARVLFWASFIVYLK